MAESKNDSPIEVPQVPPGTLTAVEVSYKPVITMSEEEQEALRSLCGTLTQRDLPARREEIIRDWEKHLFYRGLQHLIPDYSGGQQLGWVLPSVGSGYNPQDTQQRSIFETNIYNSYGQIIVSALTREVPAVRFEPVDPDSDPDITAADKADQLRECIERNNKMKALMADIVLLLWLDGRALVETGYVKDGQQFGYEEPEQEALEEKTVPEDEEQIDAEESMEEPQSEPVGGSGEEDSEGMDGEEQEQPRGRERICAWGALAAKLPIKADCLSQCPYVQIADEIDVNTARARYPDQAQKIQVEQGGPAGDDIDRLARINVKLGVFSQILTADSQIYDVTETKTWLRPSQILEVKDHQVRKSLMQKAGKDGLRVIFCGQTFCEARSIAIEDQLTLIHALPGDGMFRPGLGDWLIPIQKVFNNWMELSDDYFTHGVPQIHADNEVFDLEKLRDQTNMPGGWHPVDFPQDGTPLETHIFVEPAAQYPAQLWEFIQWFQGDLSQLLSGAFPALSGGGDSSPTDTFGGMLVQRDQALGRVGLPWRAIKEGIANIFRQAIQCLANNRTEPIRMRKDQESVTIEMQDIKGNFMAFPESDEGFPESHTQIQNRMTQLWTDATTNPAVGEFVYTADNLEVFLRAFNVKGFYLPQVAVRDKQLGENVELLNSGPVPNPKLAQIKQQLAVLQEQVIATTQPGFSNPQLTQQISQLQQMAQSLPPQVSSVEVKPWNDHATEKAVILKMLNSPRGRRMANGSEDEQAGIQNLELHMQEHDVFIEQQQSKQPKGKPPSVSIALKDLPPNEAAAAATMAGIPAQPADFKAEELADAAIHHPGQVTVQ